jgi:nucleoid DNA-binding protein
MISIIISGLKKRENIKIKNFGTFKKNLKKSRIGRNPKNNEIFEVTERKNISFKSSKYLKDKINNE